MSDRSVPLPIHTVTEEVCAAARAEGRGVLLETEALRLLEALDIATPARLEIHGSADLTADDLAQLPGDRVVVKVLSPQILHKSDVGGVVVAPKHFETVIATIRAMEIRFADRRVDGYGIFEFVEYDRTLGGELLVGMRWTDDFGPVVTLGVGGVFTEFLSSNLRPGRDVAVFSPRLTTCESIRPILDSKAVAPLITGGLRGQEARIEADRLERLVADLLEFADACVPDAFAEFEVNPLVLTKERGPVALDALATLGGEHLAEVAAPRPLDKIHNLLEPKSVAVMGVSRRPNPGHIIVRNLLREEFPLERVFVIKPGTEEFLGCRCVPDIDSLPEPVDLLIVGVDGGQVPAVVEETIRLEKAESVILIPGGLGEREGTEERVHAMRASLAESRAGAWGGPILNGGNCLGIRSIPGGYDTMFIPERKLPIPREEPVAPIAVLSQSGAFMVAKASKLGRLNPKYLISIGNQVDLTVGDYLTHLGKDESIRVFACYVEGFRPGDGLAFLEAAREITESGRTVLLYRAGRTPEGAQATASHTASIAGDFTVTRELAEAAGVVLVEGLADFEDLARLFCWLDGQRVDGLRLGCLTNAGYESVALADNLGPFELAPFSAER